MSLYVDGHLECEDEGELQLTKDGISGIPVFQVSRFAAAALDRRKRVEAKLDFFPEKDMAEFSHMLAVRMFHTAKNRTVGDALLGLLNRKLHGCVCQAAGLHPTRELSALTDKDAGRLARLCPDHGGRRLHGGTDSGNHGIPSLRRALFRGGNGGY